MKIKKEKFYKNEYAKEEELKALKKQYPAMFANKRAAEQFANMNLYSDGVYSDSSQSEKNMSSDHDVYKIMGNKRGSKTRQSRTSHHCSRIKSTQSRQIQPTGIQSLTNLESVDKVKQGLKACKGESGFFNPRIACNILNDMQKKEDPKAYEPEILQNIKAKQKREQQQQKIKDDRY